MRVFNIYILLLLLTFVLLVKSNDPTPTAKCVGTCKARIFNRAIYRGRTVYCNASCEASITETATATAIATVSTVKIASCADFYHAFCYETEPCRATGTTSCEIDLATTTTTVPCIATCEAKRSVGPNSYLCADRCTTTITEKNSKIVTATATATGTSTATATAIATTTTTVSGSCYSPYFIDCSFSEFPDGECQSEIETSCDVTLGTSTLSAPCTASCLPELNINENRYQCEALCVGSTSIISTITATATATATTSNIYKTTCKAGARASCVVKMNEACTARATVTCTPTNVVMPPVSCDATCQATNSNNYQNTVSCDASCDASVTETATATATATATITEIDTCTATAYIPSSAYYDTETSISTSCDVTLGSSIIPAPCIATTINNDPTYTKINDGITTFFRRATCITSASSVITETATATATATGTNITTVTATATATGNVYESCTAPITKFCKYDEECFITTSCNATRGTETNIPTCTAKCFIKDILDDGMDSYYYCHTSCIAKATFITTATATATTTATVTNTETKSCRATAVATCRADSNSSCKATKPASCNLP